MANLYEAVSSHSKGGDCTRILRIEASTSADDPICCALEMMPLDSPPKYFAVSHVWGDSSITRTIHVNGIQLVVRLNIWNFLLQMRANGYDDLLWIDAICINQGDIYERGRQVSIMGQIYSKAEVVCVWLGSGEEATERLVRNWNDFDWSSQQDKVDGNSDIRWTQSKTLDANRYVKIVRLSTLEYWSRTWIAQESLLAHHRPVIYGSQTLRSCIFNRDTLDHVVRQAWFIARQNGAERVTRLMRSDPFENSHLRSLLKQDSIYRSASPVWELVAAFHTSRCADARDHVYALLPLAEGGPATSHINCDCTKSTSILFREVMAPLVEMRNRGQPRVSSEEEWQGDMWRGAGMFLQIASKVQIALGLPNEDLEVVEVVTKLAGDEINTEYMIRVLRERVMKIDEDSQKARNDLDTWDGYDEDLE